jgi:hypothetical protein
MIPLDSPSERTTSKSSTGSSSKSSPGSSTGSSPGGSSFPKRSRSSTKYSSKHDPKEIPISSFFTSNCQQKHDDNQLNQGGEPVRLAIFKERRFLKR